MKLPIIIIEHGDVMIFDSVAKAELGLEPIDIKNREYDTYDGNGYLLKLIIVQKEKISLFRKSEFLDVVNIVDNDQIVDASNSLQKKLINFLRNTRTYTENDEALTLHDLIDKVIKKFGYTT